jgi:5-methylcytosine-specific restriction endonuclease McrA
MEEETLIQRDERMRLERERLAGGPRRSRHAFGELRIKSEYDGVNAPPGWKDHSPTLSSYSFYDSDAWLKIRYRVLGKYGAQCMLCGTGWTPENPIQVDHIKPRSKYPDLALDFDNLQVLCRECNMGKGNVDETDFRPKP